jgi:hypothetical protein
VLVVGGQVRHLLPPSEMVEANLKILKKEAVIPDIKVILNNILIS